VTRQQPKDRRVQKTERLLRDAIGSLIHEKRYDSIAVREILQRANVGRSAFYAHFSNKDALLATAIEQTLHEMPSHPQSASETRFGHLVGFSYGIFEHVEAFRHTATAMKGGKSRSIVHHHLRRVLLERVTAAIRQSVPRSEHAAAVPAGLLAEYVVGTFVLVLNWWVDSRSSLSPRQTTTTIIPSTTTVWRLTSSVSSRIATTARLIWKAVIQESTP
jgi:AcrR family transcriptional regulator